jgi:hypothetical protein
VNALISMSEAAPAEAGPYAKTLGAKTLSVANKTIGIKARKNQIAAGLPAHRAWRRLVIDWSLVCRHRNGINHVNWAAL